MKGAWCILAAAGSGERLGSKVPKAFARLGRTTIIQRAIKELHHQGIRNFVVALPRGRAFDVGFLQQSDAEIHTVEGGAERQDSVLNAAAMLPDDVSFVLVHDAARPFLRTGVVEELISRASETGASMPVLPVTDTLKRVSGGIIEATVPRAGIVRVQTPQVFRGDVFRAMLPLYRSMSVTDDSAVAESLGIKPAAVTGSAFTFKITTPEDLAMAELIITTRSLL
ncbi:MAG: 2-C-methyl-D-erythritol 4-phosphate cytidylyltransferase [Planctomycetota bacterium]